MISRVKLREAESGSDSVIHVLRCKLQNSLMEVVALVDRVQGLETEKASLAERLGSQQEVHTSTVNQLTTRLASSEQALSAMQLADAERRMLYDQVLSVYFVGFDLFIPSAILF